MNKKGGTAIEILVLMVVIVITSAVILLLVQMGAINVKADVNQEQILNTEFLPFGREGTIAVKSFSFCADVDDNYNCLDSRSSFVIGEYIHFRFTVETTPYNGEVMLIQNYRLLSPEGKVVLEADEKDNFHFDLRSGKSLEEVHFKDYLFTEEGDQPGIYTFELLITNSLLDKNVKVVEEFILNE